MSRRVLVVSSISFIGVGIAALFANRKANKTIETAKKAVSGLNSLGVPIVPASKGVTIPGRLTGYWPFVEGLTAKERLMEGGHNDRLGKKLYTLEDFQAGKVPYASVSADHTIFPYGQRISIPNWPDVVFRIVDTGSHFFGPKKVFRALGHEPFDVCVAARETKVYPKQVDVTLYPGDHFKVKRGSVKEIAFDKTGKPVAVGGGTGRPPQWSQLTASGFDYLGAEDA